MMRVKKMGNQVSEDELETLDESRRRMRGMQEEDIEGDEGGR